MISYEWWMHRDSGDGYAVRLMDGQVTGATGPLSAAVLAQRHDLAAADYDDVVVTARLEIQRARFAVVDAWTETPSVDRDLEGASRIQWEQGAL